MTNPEQTLRERLTEINKLRRIIVAQYILMLIMMASIAGLRLSFLVVPEWGFVALAIAATIVTLTAIGLHLSKILGDTP